LPDGREVQAITPVNDTRRRTYIGNVQVGERAAMARTARGENGDCADYVRRIRDKLRDLQITDPDVEEFARMIDG
jgi:cation transport regulator ChaC